LTSFEVRLTAGAERDLQDIDDWISIHDGASNALYVIEKLEAAVSGLRRFPERGRHPPELLALGMREYRETFFKPYRIIYFVQDGKVYVTLIADGRRDMQTLLAKRLLGA
jgi:toxin ParE1/3/4